MGAWFFAYQIARGLLMTVAILPVIYTLRLPRWQAALIVGLLVWVIGGAAPLLVPNELMLPAQRYIHIVEILTQNAALGITAVLLLRPSRSIASELERTPTKAAKRIPRSLRVFFRRGSARPQRRRAQQSL